MCVQYVRMLCAYACNVCLCATYVIYVMCVRNVCMYVMYIGYVLSVCECYGFMNLYVHNMYVM